MDFLISTAIAWAVLALGLWLATLVIPGVSVRGGAGRNDPAACVPPGWAVEEPGPHVSKS